MFVPVRRQPDYVTRYDPHPCRKFPFTAVFHYQLPLAVAHARVAFVEVIDGLAARGPRLTLESRCKVVTVERVDGLSLADRVFGGGSPITQWA